MTQRYANQKIVVVGAGKSGLALCRFFASRKADVVLSDLRLREQIEGLEILEQLPVTYDLGGHTVALFEAADLVVLSPGVPETIPPVQAAKAADIPVVGEIEIAIRELEAPMVGITGTNGKSTVTALCGEIYRHLGCKTYVGGNIGEPLVDAVNAGDWDRIVIELSSFQLETMPSFKPRYSMLLNISADHLDRYPDMEAYIAAKKNIFANQKADDFMVLNADDPQVLQAAAGSRARQILFSCTQELAEGMSIAGGRIAWRWQGTEVSFPAVELKIKGLHNIANAMAAMIPALVDGYAPGEIWQAACRFGGLPHRMCLVRTLNGVNWYNDSKGTNVGSVVMSLAGLSSPVTLIAGGKDKGGDFGVLANSVREKVRHLVLIGEAADRIEKEIGGETHVVRAGSMAEAVQRAHALTPSGGSVLLSPGCSSFDMFKNYGERGDQFTSLVQQLDEQKAVSNGNP